MASGLLDNLLNNLANPNPLMNAGLAIMAASGRPGATTASSIGEGMLSGLMASQQQQREAMRMQMLQQQQAAQQAEAERQAALRNIMIRQDPDNAQLLAAMPGAQLGDIAAQQFAGPDIPDSIQAMMMRMENPELNAAFLADKAAGAQRLTLDLGKMDEPLTIEQIGKMYMPGDPGFNFMGHTMRSAAAAGAKIKEAQSETEGRQTTVLKSATEALSNYEKIARDPEYGTGVREVIGQIDPMLAPIKTEQSKLADVSFNQWMESYLTFTRGADYSEESARRAENIYRVKPTDPIAVKNVKIDAMISQTEAMHAGASRQQLDKMEQDTQKALDRVQGIAPSEAQFKDMEQEELDAEIERLERALENM